MVLDGMQLLDVSHPLSEEERRAAGVLLPRQARTRTHAHTARFSVAVLEKMKTTTDRGLKIMATFTLNRHRYIPEFTIISQISLPGEMS